MRLLSTAWKILRDLGPSWVLTRIGLEAQLRFGILKRRLPVSEWDFNSGNWLRSDVPNDPDGLKRRLTTDAKFFFEPGQLAVVSEASGICEQADRVLAGEWPYFSHTWFKVGFPPDWQLNVFDGSRAEDRAHWSEIGNRGQRIENRRRNHAGSADVKFVWELSRFSVVYLLARAFAASRDGRYAEGFWILVEDWAEKNLPNSGVNWASGQEAAFRVMSWCFGLHAFLKSPASTDDRVFRLVRMIEAQGERIDGYFDYALSQKNNHGISEAVGLFTIGILFPQLHRADEWKWKGRRLIVKQLGEQVYDDGSYIQHSFNYQRVLLDNLIWAFRLGELNLLPFPEESYPLLKKALAFMQKFCDPKTGKMPNYGGNDGSLVLPLSSCDYADYRSSIEAGHYLISGERLYSDSACAEQTEWLFGCRIGNSAGIEAEPPKHEARLRGKGLLSAADSRPSGYPKLEARESYAMLRAAKYRHRPAQADQLHLDLWWRGENIACDAGTYLYSGAPPWINTFAGTAVHNTVTIVNCDQMTRVGRFLWLDWAQAESISYDVGKGASAVEAWHDGYRKFEIVHRRSVMCLHSVDVWIVVDDIIGSSAKCARLHWLFPDYRFRWEADKLRLALQTQSGEFQCQIHAIDLHSVQLVRGGKCINASRSDSGPSQRILGWQSLYYGTKHPALSLSIETRSKVPARFVTVFAPAETELIHIDGAEVGLRSTDAGRFVALGAAGTRHIFSQLRPS